METFKQKIFKEILENFFKVRYVVIIVSTIYIFYLAYKMKERNESLKDIVSVVTSGAVCITLFYSIFTYEHNRRKTNSDTKSAKDLMTFKTAIEWHKPPLVDYMLSVFVFKQENQQYFDERNGKRINDLLENKYNFEQRKALISLLNYFESISLGVSKGLMDEDFIQKFFGSVFAKYYSDFSFWIEFRRSSRNNHKIWNSFTNLAERWIKE